VSGAGGETEVEGKRSRTSLTSVFALLVSVSACRPRKLRKNVGNKGDMRRW
jgi:hypothetical protein